MGDNKSDDFEAELRDLLESAGSNDHPTSHHDTHSAAHQSTHNDGSGDVDIDMLYDSLRMALGGGENSTHDDNNHATILQQHESEAAAAADSHLGDESSLLEADLEDLVSNLTQGNMLENDHSGDDSTLEQLIRTLLPAESSRESSVAPTPGVVGSTAAKSSAQGRAPAKKATSRKARAKKDTQTAAVKVVAPPKPPAVVFEPGGLTIAETLARTRSSMQRKEPAPSKIDPMLNRRAIFQPSQYSAAAAKHTRPANANVAVKSTTGTKFQVYTPPADANKTLNGTKPMLQRTTILVNNKPDAPATIVEGPTITDASKRRRAKHNEFTLVNFLENAASSTSQGNESSTGGDAGLSTEAIDMLSAAIEEWTDDVGGVPDEDAKRARSRVLARVRKIRAEMMTPEEKERVRIDNRERKKRWRNENAERNKENDLKMRVHKRANKVFGPDDSDKKSQWIAEEIEKRRERRKEKEAQLTSTPTTIQRRIKVDDSAQEQESMRALIDGMSSNSDLSEALLMIVKNKNLLRQFLEEAEEEEYTTPQKRRAVEIAPPPALVIKETVNTDSTTPSRASTPATPAVLAPPPISTPSASTRLPKTPAAIVPPPLSISTKSLNEMSTIAPPSFTTPRSATKTSTPVPTANNASSEPSNDTHQNTHKSMGFPPMLTR